MRKLAALTVLLLGACAPDAPVEEEPGAGATGAVQTEETLAPEVPRPPLSPAELAAAGARVTAYVDSVDRRLRTVPGLTRDERGRLRRDVNERQIQRARMLGIRPGAPVAQLVGAGRLVELEDTTPLWTVRELDY